MIIKKIPSQNVKLNLLIFIAIILLGNACSTARFVEPLEKDEWAIGANAGGPIIDFAGATIPVPLTSIVAGYGLRDNLTTYGALHTTSLLYKTFQLELGIRGNLYESKGFIPSVSYLGAIHSNVSLRDGQSRFFPELNITPYWKYGNWTTYLNGVAFLDFYKLNKKNYGYDKIFVEGLAIGQQYKHKSWTFGIEYKRLAQWADSNVSIVGYKSANNMGAHGVYFQIFKTITNEK